MPERATDSEAAAPGWLARWRRRRRSRKVVVQDRSMEPAFRPGDRLWVDPTAYRDHPPARGDVVIIADPADLEKRLLKRVVGVAGEFVRITRDGIEIRASAGFDGAGESGALEELQVPAGHVFVLSDRTARTRDSRQFGPVPRDTVLGRVWYRYYPPDRVAEIDGGPQA